MNGQDLTRQVKNKVRDKATLDEAEEGSANEERAPSSQPELTEGDD